MSAIDVTDRHTPERGLHTRSQMWSSDKTDAKETALSQSHGKQPGPLPLPFTSLFPPPSPRPPPTHTHSPPQPPQSEREQHSSGTETETVPELATLGHLWDYTLPRSNNVGSCMLKFRRQCACAIDTTAPSGGPVFPSLDHRVWVLRQRGSRAG